MNDTRLDRLKCSVWFCYIYDLSSFVRQICFKEGYYVVLGRFKSRLSKQTSVLLNSDGWALEFFVV